MASIVLQRDLIFTLKKETNLNIGLLSKLQPMFPELSRLIFKENALEKPTQILFNHLSYYLVSIIDAQVSISLTWPLYDTKAERAYRNELSKFISDYSSKGLLTPVMSSYLVNPGCFKVTVLLFQLTQLAVNHVLVSKMVNDSQKKLYGTMTEKYKSQNKDSFIECIDKETQSMYSKFTNYLCKRKIIENIAELFRRKISEMEATLSSTKAQEYINKLVDDYVSQNDLDDSSKTEVLQIKNICEQPVFIDKWLSNVDEKLNEMEKQWDIKVSPLLESSRCTLDYTECLINRHTGQTDKSSYTIEYNPKEDRICTKYLQNQVNSHQKFILKNLEKDGKLYFPNLIRAYVISMSFILKNNEISDDIFKLNEHLEGGKRHYAEIVSALRILVERVLRAESRLQIFPTSLKHSVSIRGHSEIPPLPDLSDLKINRDEYKVLFDTFTPFNLTKHQFNLLRKTRVFAKPQPKLLAPYQAPKDDFLRSLISCRISSYDHLNSSHVNHNISVISNTKANETIAECSSGFTKQQILRLLSSKKTSSSKKHKFSQERPNIKIKKGGLFQESNIFNESNGLFRSYSSPNLFENREKTSNYKGKGRKLSIMQEDSPSQFEMSGIACLNTDSNYSTPHGFVNAESSRKEDSSSLPIIFVTDEAGQRINNFLNGNNSDANKLNSDIVSPILEASRNVDLEMPTMDTPKTNAQLVKKTSSLEKIINRFKKVRANVMQNDSKEIITILEEKENNFNTCNTANRILLPDLLSPSCSTLEIKQNISENYLHQLCEDMDKADYRRPRESLGTALGVDQTFLDQFDLID